MYYVYILYSEKDGKFYIGSTPDLQNRITKHNNGYVAQQRIAAHYNISFT
jgi:putative endonuclease